MNKLIVEKSKQGRSKLRTHMAEALPTHSQQKKHSLNNSKTTKERLDEIAAYNLELESDMALAETAEIT